MQGNLATLYRWTQDPREPGNWQVQRPGDLLAARRSSAIARRRRGLSVTSKTWPPPARGQPPWRERAAAAVTANAAYDETNDAVQLSHLDVESEAVRLNVTGRIDRWSKDRQLALAGKTEYDLEKLSHCWCPWRGAKFARPGVSRALFACRADRNSDPTERRGGRSSRSGDPASGRQDGFWLAVGVAVRLRHCSGQSCRRRSPRECCKLLPRSSASAADPLTLAPAVRLAPAPAELHVPAGLLVDRVHSQSGNVRAMVDVRGTGAGRRRRRWTARSPCNWRAARYRLPALRREVGGQVIVHSIEVEPGPLVRELATVLAQRRR